MKRAVVLILCLLLCALVGGSVATAQNVENDFSIKPLTANDKETISKIFKPLEHNWVEAQDLAKYPGIYWQEDWQKQSFRIASNQKGLEDVYFVPIAANYAEGLKSQKPWSQSVSLLIIDRKNNAIRVLPTHAVMEWNAFDIGSVAFRDVRNDGLRSIIVDVRGITGIGPTGAVPFDVFAVYLPSADGAWSLDPGLQKRLEGSQSFEQTMKIAKAYFQKKH